MDLSPCNKLKLDSMYSFIDDQIIENTIVYDKEDEDDLHWSQSQAKMHSK